MIKAILKYGLVYVNINQSYEFLNGLIQHLNNDLGMKTVRTSDIT